MKPSNTKAYHKNCHLYKNAPLAVLIKTHLVPTQQGTQGNTSQVMTGSNLQGLFTHKPLQCCHVPLWAKISAVARVTKKNQKTTHTTHHTESYIKMRQNESLWILFLPFCSSSSFPISCPICFCREMIEERASSPASCSAPERFKKNTLKNCWYDMDVKKKIYSALKELKCINRNEQQKWTLDGNSTLKYCVWWVVNLSVLVGTFSWVSQKKPQNLQAPRIPHSAVTQSQMQDIFWHTRQRSWLAFFNFPRNF